MITPPENRPSPHTIPSDNESISSETSISVTTEAQPLHLYPTDKLTTEPSDETPQKNSIETLSTRTLHILHHNVSNLSSIPPSSTPASYKNRTPF